jgi:thiol-disulfide isomerase/thioredoxin
MPKSTSAGHHKSRRAGAASVPAKLLDNFPPRDIFRPVQNCRILSRYLLSAALALTTLRAYGGDDDPKPAPQFRAKTVDGESFNNQSVKGKVVLLEFWTTWCPYCRNEELLVDQVNHDYTDKGLIVLAVDVGESKKKVKQYLAEHRRSCRIVLTDDTNLAAMYAATSYPIYVIIGRDGNIAGEQRGAGGERGLKYLLRSAGLLED